MNKEETYQLVLSQAKSLFEKENDLIANMANLSALLYENFNCLWVGFYRAAGNELVLGPFQGPLACTRIQKSKGVCGTAWAEEKTLVVPNVHEFTGHIACSSRSNSEIVLPVYHKGIIVGVLDIDSEEFDDFDEMDAEYLKEIIALL